MPALSDISWPLQTERLTIRPVRLDDSGWPPRRAGPCWRSASPTPLGLRRVYANCFAGNERSWRLMERIGMRREVCTLKESLHRSGEWLDAMSYGLLAEEWRTGVTAPALDPTLEQALRP